MAFSPANRRPPERPRSDRVRRVLPCLAFAALLVTQPPPASAQSRNSRPAGAVTLDAASSDVDYRSNTVVFRDIVITQGTVRVAAQRARATGLDFENSTWSFEGAVLINVDGGTLRSDAATVNFAANRVASARIRGRPAEFEQARAGSADPARGRAGAIDYDVTAGTVTLVGDAWLTDGRNEIRGQQLTYDVRGQRVQSGSRPGQSDRVQITIRPRESAGGEPAGGEAAATPAPDAAAGEAAAPATGPAPAARPGTR